MGPNLQRLSPARCRHAYEQLRRSLRMTPCTLFFPCTAVASSQASALALDAADGVIDGKFYGSQVAVAAPRMAPTYSMPAATYAAPATYSAPMAYSGVCLLDCVLHRGSTHLSQGVGQKRTQHAS